MSKNAIIPAVQNVFAAASNLASCNVLAALYLNCSSANFSNTGSIHTSRYTSFIRLTVMLLSLL